MADDRHVCKRELSAEFWKLHSFHARVRVWNTQETLHGKRVVVAGKDWTKSCVAILDDEWILSILVNDIGIGVGGLGFVSRGRSIRIQCRQRLATVAMFLSMCFRVVQAQSRRDGSLHS